MPPARSQKSLDAALAAVRAARELDVDGARGALLKGLGHKSWLVAAKGVAKNSQARLRVALGRAFGD